MTAVGLTEYQKNWMKDSSRFKIGCFTRQGGKSFVTSLEVVFDCRERRSKWVLLSAGERQSRELIGTAAMHSRATGVAIEELEDDFLVSDERYRMLELRYENGSRIIGLPANPDTARGWSANILLDEFALHRHCREIWKSMFPTITRGYRILVVSTFRGKKNKFYELMYSAPTLQRYTGPEYEYIGDRGGWSKHLISIYDAVKMGLELTDDSGEKIEAEDLRLALNDDDAWQEEYECIPSDEASAFIPHDLISAVEDVKIDKSPDWAEYLLSAAYDGYRENRRNMSGGDFIISSMPAFSGDIYVGFDVGRRKDLSVIWLDERLEDGILKAVAVIELRRAPFWVQESVLFSILTHPKMRRACIDESGIGMQLSESAIDRFGEWKVEGIAFTQGAKEGLAYGLKQNLEDRLSLIPADPVIRGSFHAVKKYSTATRHFRFDAERTEKTGHSDHFWAKALSVSAATGHRTGPVVYEKIMRPRFKSKGAY